nr:MAG TPA: hypothetical protein [Caudoviricetes sp.]
MTPPSGGVIISTHPEPDKVAFMDECFRGAFISVLTR